MSKKPAKTGKRGKGRTAPISGSPMDVGLLEQIIKLMSANDLNTVEVRDGDKRVVLKRGANVITHNPGMTFSGPQMYAMPSNPGTPPVGAGAAATPVDENAGLLPVKSPMVGTFYSASSPDAKPFVQVGSSVDDETDVCIIEAMKVFNNIKAECRGTIAKILVTNGQTVEFGQILFLVKP